MKFYLVTADGVGERLLALQSGLLVANYVYRPLHVV